MKEYLRRTKEAGFSAHLEKPVNLDQLRLLLERSMTPMGQPHWHRHPPYIAWTLRGAQHIHFRTQWDASNRWLRADIHGS